MQRHDRGVAGDHHHRHGFTHRPADPQHQRGQHTGFRGWQGDIPHGLPTRGTQREGSLAVGIGYSIQRVFCDGDNSGNGDQCQQDRAGKGGQPGGNIQEFPEKGNENEDTNKPKYN